MARRPTVAKRWHDGTATAVAAGLVLGTVVGGGGAAAQEGPVFDAGGVALAGSGPDTVVGGLGAFQVFDDGDDTLAAATVEYRAGTKLVGIGPLGGLEINHRGGGMVYAGVYADFEFGDVLTLTPFATLGGYWEGDGSDLGGAFQFRTGLDLAHPFSWGRVGVRLSHISHAGVYDDNPGAESVFLVVGVPLN